MNIGRDITDRSCASNTSAVQSECLEMISKDSTVNRENCLLMTNQGEATGRGVTQLELYVERELRDQGLRVRTAENGDLPTTGPVVGPMILAFLLASWTF